MDNLREHALNAKAWPFVEARTLLKRLNNKIPEKGFVLFETGYGPSGLPHIGTFGEVVRTSMMVNALRHLTDLPTEIITFSDDMDGLRKVPENIPNKNILENTAKKSKKETKNFEICVLLELLLRLSHFQNLNQLSWFLDTFNQLTISAFMKFSKQKISLT